MKKKALCLVWMFLFFTLSGCGPAELQVPEEQTAPEQADYPMHIWSWLDDQQTVAVEYQGKIRYLDLDNRVTAVAEIPPEQIPEVEYRILFHDNGFFLYPNGDHQFPTVCKIDGEWRLYNGSIHRRDGSLVEAFPPLSFTGDGLRIVEGEEVKEYSRYSVEHFWFEQGAWLTEDRLMLVALNALFYYCPSTGEVQKVDDFTPILPEGKEGVYYGIRSFVPMDGGCVYLAYDQPDRYSSMGRVYYADESGHRSLLMNGEVVGSLSGVPGIAVVQTYREDPVTRYTVGTDMAYCIDGENFVQMPSVEGWAMYRQAVELEDGWRIWYEGTPEPGDRDCLYVYDTASGQLGTHFPPLDAYVPRLVTVRGEWGGLEYIYTAGLLADDTLHTYLYREATGETVELEERIEARASEVHRSFTHYVKETRYETDEGKVTRVAVRLIQ